MAEERGRCREVLNKSQCMDFLFAGTKKRGRCREVAVSGGSTIRILLTPKELFAQLLHQLNIHLP